MRALKSRRGNTLKNTISHFSRHMYANTPSFQDSVAVNEAKLQHDPPIYRLQLMWVKMECW